MYSLSATLYALITEKESSISVTRLSNDGLKDLKKEKLPLRTYQVDAIKNGLIVRPDRRTQSMEEFRSALYNLPLPEEIIRHRRVFRRIGEMMTALLLLLLLVLINFTCGIPLGQGLLYSLRSDGFHIVSEIDNRETCILPEK